MRLPPRNVILGQTQVLVPHCTPLPTTATWRPCRRLSPIPDVVGSELASNASCCSPSPLAMAGTESALAPKDQAASPLK